ncbi:cutinase family protein [Gordonia sp. Z-3]|uniref:cutinase family protein n=1 Tax=unclassified Gordonia (in: high G+C Gram-positive bacteria) TaxID=2657482 RepID=UPI00257D8F1B|nr:MULTISPECIES: cutinase family protein [unclassified Gordonia (in: high G+C Gram-positive bacteria)]MED5800950.1 cutinase family protein [Gordonia sp. Z-3]
MPIIGLTALSVVAVGLLTAPAPAPADAHGAPTFNLFIPGTWETDETADPSTPIGALKPIAERIRRDHGTSAHIYFLPYLARAFDNGESYGVSKATALDNAARVLRDFTARHPTAKVTITGYSQGADAAGDLASAIGNRIGPVTPDKVLAVALLADPRAGTRGETVVGPRADGVGIADPRPAGMGTLAGRVSSICAPADLYCSIDKRQNPFLGQLGSALGKTPDQAVLAVRRAATAAGTLASLDLHGIAAGLAALPTQAADGDLAAAHATATELNADLRPLVTLAAAVDFAEISAVLALIPDETGFAKAMSVVAAGLSHVDVERTADLVGRIQQLTWVAAAEVGQRAGAKTLPVTGHTRAEVARLGRELGQVARGVVSATPQAGSGMPVVSPDFKNSATAVTRIVAKYAITDPATLVTDAVSAGKFYSGESHVHYGSLVVDANGNNAVSWLAQWLTTAIAQA